jgi:hypothetical protein
MLIKIGNAVVNVNDISFAWVADDKKSIEVQFRDHSTRSVETEDAEADLTKLERATFPQ